VEWEKSAAGARMSSSAIQLSLSCGYRRKIVYARDACPKSVVYGENIASLFEDVLSLKVPLDKSFVEFIRECFVGKVCHQDTSMQD
jgi:hypothetical protein